MFIYIFYLVLRKNKGLYVYLYLLSRDAREQGITRLHIFYLVMLENKGLYVYMCLVSRIA
jgi:hypothetical protein